MPVGNDTCSEVMPILQSLAIAQSNGRRCSPCPAQHRLALCSSIMMLNAFRVSVLDAFLRS
jgi:hypothetical protein